jgi:tyrosine-protein kinase Etk/Wzc
LRKPNGRLALTGAAQRRLFFHEQLEREKNDLEDELKKKEEQTGLIAPNGQAQIEIEATAQIQAQIASCQVELAAVRQSTLTVFNDQ